jgi:hypothetical protein
MTELTRYSAYVDPSNFTPRIRVDDSGALCLFSGVEALIATLRKQLEGRWIPWKPGDALPRDGTYWITQRRIASYADDGTPLKWDEPKCRVLRTDNPSWWLNEDVYAYWSIPLPAPYSTTGGK